jgi:glutamyl-tRNA synthetase/glutamyl-Q tRNA(Asp) synthetase
VILHEIPRGFTTRFAPAPTGHLHLGHIVNAVWVWGLAGAYGGRVLLRLEDHDRGRCRREYEASILDDLEWLGLVPHEPQLREFREGPPLRFRQSDNLERYAEVLAGFEARGLAYACRCSRADVDRAWAAQWEREQPGIPMLDGVEPRYLGTCRHAHVDGASTPARRILMDADDPIVFEDLRKGRQVQEPSLQCGDLLARDRNGNYTYQFCVSVDDVDQGVTLVIRGEDLLESTGRQILLHRLLGHERPPFYLHHQPVLHPDGRKLSKSAGDTAVRELKAFGATPEAVLGRAARLGGLPHDGSPIAADELHRLFR